MCWWLVAPELDFLTARQAEVARLVAEGLSDKEIGVRLGISTQTVKRHLGCVRNRLGVRCRVSIAVFVLCGWLPRGAYCNVHARYNDAA